MFKPAGNREGFYPKYEEIGNFRSSSASLPGCFYQFGKGCSGKCILKAVHYGPSMLSGQVFFSMGEK
jgi:hypothetical protein